MRVFFFSFPYKCYDIFPEVDKVLNCWEEIQTDIYINEMNFTLCVLFVYNDNETVQTLCITRVISVWQNFIKGVPQWSILGPLMFTGNVFINDIFFYIIHDSVSKS